MRKTALILSVILSFAVINPVLADNITPEDGSYSSDINVVDDKTTPSNTKYNLEAPDVCKDKEMSNSKLCKEIAAKKKKANDSSIINTYITKLLPAVGALAMLMLIYAAFLYTTAGNTGLDYSSSEEKVKKAKYIVQYTLTGLVVIVLAGFIISLVLTEVAKI